MKVLSILFLPKKLLNSPIKVIIAVAVIGAVGYFGWQKLYAQNSKPQYQTAQVEKGTLVESVTASGQITSANNVTITIQASGVVNEVFVKNGDSVTQGEKIATLTLDQASQQKQAAALSSYLSSKSQLDSAQAKINSLQSTEFSANQKFINDAVARGLKTDDPTYIQENATWLQAEADYKNQQGAIQASQASLNSAALTLSQTSSIITAPAAGIVKGLTIAPGSVVTLSSTSSTTSTSQVLGSINQQGPTQAQVNLSELDSVNVSEGQKVTLTLDAFPDKTFTGKVTSINTNGVVSSGVTTYPAVISFDNSLDRIYPNMGVNAKIIIKVKDNVLLVPSSAVQTTNGQTTIKELKNGNLVNIPVELGDTSDTQTEITSGVNEGDSVVTSVTNSTISTQSGGSVFGVRGFGGGFGGGRGGR